MRTLFVEHFYYHVLSHLQPYPLPRCVVAMDNASIHLDSRIAAMLHSVGAMHMPMTASTELLILLR